MGRQPLEGVKVVDFGWIAVVPISCTYLSQHGAEVIRIESLTRPDEIRVGGPPFKDNIPGVNRSAYFANYNAGKYGVSLNLKHPKGVEIAKRLVSRADIAVEGFTAGTMERLGLGYEELRKVNPDIIMLSTCIHGQTGPHAMHPTLGTQLTALAGFVHLTGWPDRGPGMPFGAYTDTVVPQFVVTTMLSALDYRNRTGKGQYIDLSQFEASIQFLAPVVLDFTVNNRVADREGNRSLYASPHGVYACRGEDRWCAIAVFTEEEWKSFILAIGEPEWTEDPKLASFSGRKENEDELDRLVGDWTCNFTAEEVMIRLQSFGVPAGVVETCEDVHHDPQLKHRHHFRRLEHPEIGKHTYDCSPFRLSRNPTDLQMPGPCLGEHNEHVFTKILGMSDEEFVQLLGEGVFD